MALTTSEVRAALAAKLDRTVTLAEAEVWPADDPEWRGHEGKFLEYHIATGTYSVGAFRTDSVEDAVAVFNAVTCSEHLSVVEDAILEGMSVSDVLSEIGRAEAASAHGPGR